MTTKDVFYSLMAVLMPLSVAYGASDPQKPVHQPESDCDTHSEKELPVAKKARVHGDFKAWL